MARGWVSVPDNSTMILEEDFAEANTATESETTTAAVTTKWVTPARVAVVAEKYDVRRSGVVWGSTADQTTALASAVTPAEPCSGDT